LKGKTIQVKTYSNWLKTDLHIHSIASNIMKKNDYTGDSYTAKELIDKLKENKVNLFSITDHNIINIDLYKSLFKLLKAN